MEIVLKCHILIFFATYRVVLYMDFYLEVLSYVWTMSQGDLIFILKVVHCVHCVQCSYP